LQPKLDEKEEMIMLRARDVMQTQVVTVSPSLSLAELELVLEREGVSGVPVVDYAELCGVVSRTDLTRTLADAEGSAEATLAYYQEVGGAAPSPASAGRMASEQVATKVVRDIMTAEILAVSGERPVREVAQMMVTRRVHRLLVTEGRRLLGLVTTLDLVRAIAEGKLAT
jgi:CBS domain-containing protein